jgi:hypothetical protein
MVTGSTKFAGGCHDPILDVGVFVWAATMSTIEDMIVRIRPIAVRQ